MPLSQVSLIVYYFKKELEKELSRLSLTFIVKEDTLNITMRFVSLSLTFFEHEGTEYAISIMDSLNTSYRTLFITKENITTSVALKSIIKIIYLLYQINSLEEKMTRTLEKKDNAPCGVLIYKLQKEIEKKAVELKKVQQELEALALFDLKERITKLNSRELKSLVSLFESPTYSLTRYHNQHPSSKEIRGGTWFSAQHDGVFEKYVSSLRKEGVAGDNLLKQEYDLENPLILSIYEDEIFSGSLVLLNHNILEGKWKEAGEEFVDMKEPSVEGYNDIFKKYNINKQAIKNSWTTAFDLLVADYLEAHNYDSFIMKSELHTHVFVLNI